MNDVCTTELAPDTQLSARLGAYRARIEQVLDRALAQPEGGTERLQQAMRYSTLGAGKRLRPSLVYLTGECLGAPLDEARRAGGGGGTDPRLQPGAR